MRIIAEEFWSPIKLPSMYIVTTNGVVGDDGSLVMGTGIAMQAKNKIRGIDKECGAYITANGHKMSGCKYLYYFAPIRMTEGKNFFGIFQVKLDWRSPADIYLMETSCVFLKEFMEEHPEINFRMNYPAIGAGKLSEEVVYPLLNRYFKDKDNISFCKRLSA